MTEKKILSTIEYFTFFKYPPNFAEIYAFVPKKTTKKELQIKLNTLVNNGRIFYDDRLKRYTPSQYQSISKNYKNRVRNTQDKLKKVRSFIKVVSYLPQIKLLGFSGSVAMNSAESGDDIDFFVIARKNRVWTARFIALILASLLGKRRKRGDRHEDDKICLNLFFEETSMAVPGFKRTAYVGHEVLQMKPVLIREDTYKRFIEANKWIFKLFPNAPRAVIRPKPKAHLRGVPGHLVGVLAFLGDIVETVLKKLQLFLINRHKTSEIITDKQLWFFPEDFERKIKI